MERQKRVLAIHDISGIGKCSLTVALPIISAAGVECSVLPTAVLSTHTGGFTGYTFRDLTEDIAPMVRHWKQLGEHFDMIYTGYLGSFEQIELMGHLFAALAAKDTVLVVDPVLGDNGRLYPGFRLNFPAAMKKLCEKADIIMPNLTEATLMLGEEYVPGPYSKDYIEGLLHRLAEAMTLKKIILTGVFFDEKQLGAASFDTATGEIEYILGKEIPGIYHGTGDVFGSALVGAMAIGKPLGEAVRIAVDFTMSSISRTQQAGTPVRYGVNFEACLGSYMQALGLI